MAEATTKEAVALEFADADLNDVPDMMECCTGPGHIGEANEKIKPKSHLRIADYNRGKGDCVVRKAFHKGDLYKRAVGFAIWQAMRTFPFRPLLRGRYYPRYNLTDYDWGEMSL